MLGRFLRDRRNRITLEQVGVPARRTRRGATITQEDLARLTGYSIRTISALEQGAEHQPSRELLDAITSALRLTHDERSILWYLATGAPPPEPDRTAEADLAIGRIVQAVSPNPAYLTDEYWNVHSQNPAFARWICDFTDAPGDQRTILHWFFLQEHSKHVLVEWEREATALMALVRGRVLRSPDGHDLMETVEEICGKSQDAQRIWDSGRDLLVHGPSREMVFRPPGHTDPLQPDDEAHQVRLTIATLTPLRAGDARRLLVFLLPDGYPPIKDPERPCAACIR